VIARETDISTLTRLLYIAYFLEVGLILLFIPWSVFWERNFFAESLPLVHAVVKNNFMRGAISGIGVLNLLAGLADLRTLIPWERR
jgi:hypothetical protein